MNDYCLSRIEARKIHDAAFSIVVIIRVAILAGKVAFALGLLYLFVRWAAPS